MAHYDTDHILGEGHVYSITLNSFSLKLNKSSKELCHKTKILLYFSKNSHAYGNYEVTLISFLKNSHAYGNQGAYAY